MNKPQHPFLLDWYVHKECTNEKEEDTSEVSKPELEIPYF